MSCPTQTGPSTAVTTVENGWNHYRGLSDRLLSDARAASSELAELELEGQSLGNVAFEIPGGYSLPNDMDIPEAPDLDYTPDGELARPTAPTIVPATASPAGVPAFTLNLPLPSYPALGTAPVKSLPAAPSTSEVTLPTYVGAADPQLPELVPIDLPAVPTLDLPTFSATAPSATGLTPPEEAFAYQEEEFSETLVDELRSKISTWLSGGQPTGLPDHIWQHIWQQQRSRELQSSKAAMQAAITDWRSRGFTLPGGVLDAKLTTIRLKTQETEATLGREIAVQAAKMEQTNLQFAMEKGIALTQLLSEMFNQRVQRAFAIAQFTFQSALTLYNAKVEAYKALLAGYQAEAAVFAERVKGAMLVLEAYKAQLEGEKLVGELNQQAVQLYVAQWQGIQAAAEVYKTRVAAIQAAVEVDKVKMELYRTRVEVFGEEVKAYLGEVQAYQARVGAYDSEVKAYDSAVRAHVARIEGVKTTNELSLANAKLQNEANALSVEAYKAEMQGWASAVSAQSDRLRAIAAVFGGKAQIYQAQGTIAEASVRAQTERYRAAVEEGKARAEVDLEKVKLDISQVQRLTELEVQARIKSAEIFGQLSAATMAAVNLGATISTQDSSSVNCQTTHSYSY